MHIDTPSKVALTVIATNLICIIISSYRTEGEQGASRNNGIGKQESTNNECQKIKERRKKKDEGC